MGATAIDMREFARRGNALAAYDGLDRHLSHHASHPPLSAVNDYLVDGADSVDAMIVAEVIAAEALKDKLKVMASDSGRIKKRERLIVTSSVLDLSARRL